MAANEKRIVHAVSKLGRRVTAADVVHETGEPLLAVQSELNKLASQTNCVLEVSNTGAVVYVFQPHFARTLRMRVFMRKALWLPTRLWRQAKYLFRISFGIDLILSLVVSAVIVICIVLSSPEGWNFTGGGGGSGKSKADKKRKAQMDTTKAKLASGEWQQACSHFFFGDPENHASKGYLDQCFLFLFGPPDPNRNRLDRQWENIASLIEQKDGALTFEQIQPWLADPPSEEEQEKSIFHVMARFDGRPEVTEAGDIVYVFPLLKETALAAGEKKIAVADDAFFEEATWEAGDQKTVKTLALINFGLCVVVFFAVRTIGMFLLPNAFGFFVLAGITAWRMEKANEEMSGRNKQRKALARKVGTKETQKKILAARQYAVRAIQVDKDDIAYRSDKDLVEQEIEAGAKQVPEKK